MAARMLVLVLVLVLVLLVLPPPVALHPPHRNLR
jgi:hypothetical protein